MSLAPLGPFRNTLTANPALQQACLDAFSAGRHEEVMALGKPLGLEFSADDVTQCLADAELSDFELELVSAGMLVARMPKDTKPQIMK